MIGKGIIILISIILIICISCCISGNTIEPTEVDITNGSGLGFILLDNEVSIPQNLCLERNLTDKIIILESKYCGACRIAVPRLKEIEQELNAKFVFLDLSKQEDVERMKEFKIMPKYTPTVLIGCDIYIGAYSKENYKELISDFLKSE